MKKFRKLIPALALLLVSAVLMSTASYAWFSMNNRVTVTGMEVKTKTSDNLFIVADTLTSNTVQNDTAFKTSVTGRVKAILEPVSTVDGSSFYYTSTSNVAQSGDALSDTYIEYNASTAASDTTNYSSAFSQNYGVTKTDAAGYPNTRAEGYVDYVFQIKAINASSAAEYVNVTKIDLTYGGTTDTDKAFRVAVFVEDLGAAAVYTAATAPSGNLGTLLSIVKASDAAYFQATSGESNTAPDAVASVSGLADVQKLNTALTIGTVAQGTTHYYKVVVRLWIEGEDTTCNNSTFAALTDTWALDIEMTLENSTTNAKNAINTGVTASKLDLSAAPSSGAAAAYTIDGIGYYEISGATGYYLTTASTAVSSSSIVYKIVDNHPIDVTNQCKLPA